MWLLIEKLWVRIWTRHKGPAWVAVFTVLVIASAGIFVSTHRTEVEAFFQNTPPPVAHNSVNTSQPSPKPFPPRAEISPAAKRVTTADSITLFGDSVIWMSDYISQWVHERRFTGVPVSEYHELLEREKRMREVYTELLSRSGAGGKQAADKIAKRKRRLNVTGSWTGDARDLFFNLYHVFASISKEGDSTISGYFVWSGDHGEKVQEPFSGVVVRSREFKFDGTHLLNLGNGWGEFRIGHYYATLSDNGDTLGGGWESDNPGAFVLQRTSDPLTIADPDTSAQRP